MAAKPTTRGRIACFSFIVPVPYGAKDTGHIFAISDEAEMLKDISVII